MHRFRWFVLGIAFGAIGAVFARGDGPKTFHDLRAWSAKALRSLERSAPPPAKLQPSTAAPSARPGEVAIDAPCPMNPGPGDPCAELLAPFAEAPKPPVPTVSIDALPRVRPPVVARHHRHVTPAAPPAPAAAIASDTPPEPAEPPEPSDDQDESATTAQNDLPPTP